MIDIRSLVSSKLCLALYCFKAMFVVETTTLTLTYPPTYINFFQILYQPTNMSPFNTLNIKASRIIIFDKIQNKINNL